jgi:Malectin domain
MPTTADFDRERLELATLLATGIFNRAPSLAQLLTYICERHFQGESDQLKEYNIAVEALGRPPEFDQKRDSIVRVEAHRLRKRLKEYYETEGANHPVQIVIPQGHYAPKFIYPSTEPAVLPPAPSSQLEVQRPTIEFSAIRPGSRKVRLWAGAIAVCLVVAGFAATVAFRVASKAASPGTIVGRGDAPSSGEEIRILAGSEMPYVDHLGRTWLSDRFFTGGTTFAVPNHSIFGTRDPKMYQTRREGPFNYDIPLKPGVYELRLHFAETLFGDTNIAGGGETSRLFNVRANGKTILDQVDVIADAGASTADVRVFKDVSPAEDAKLHLQFEGVISGAILNAIELTPGTPGRLRPIRIVAADHSYTDKRGNVWLADRFSKGGRTVGRSDPVSGTDDPELYRSERFGNFTYTIPVAKGKYAVTLKFAETWFGPIKPGQGGTGSRAFDILCNGTALVRKLDVYKEAGGGDRALDKTFHNLEPSPQGKLIISFVPIANYACINALEVIDESK